MKRVKIRDATKKPKSVNQDEKTRFRRSKKWKQLRDMVKREQKVDPITLKPLSNTYNLHHRNCDPDAYTDISNSDNFVGLNSSTHETVHYFWGDARHRKPWRDMVLRLVEQLLAMDAAYTGELEYPEE